MLRKLPKGYPLLSYFTKQSLGTRKNSNKQQVVDTVQALEHSETALHDQVRRVPFYWRADKRLSQANRTRYAAAYPFSAYPKR